MTDTSVDDRHHQQQPAAQSRFTAGGGNVLTLDCPERPGIVNAVSGFLLERHGDIRELKQFDDQRHGHCFLRVHFSIPSAAPHQQVGVETAGPVDLVDDLTPAFGDVAERFDVLRAAVRRRAATGPDHGVKARALPQRPAVPRRVG